MSDLYVSVSWLTSYRNCPYRFKNEERVFEQTVKQRRGELFHESVEKYVRFKWTVEDGKSHITESFPIGDEGPDVAAEIATKFANAFAWLVSTRWIDLDRFIACEQKFKLRRTLADGRPYVLGGRVDAIRRSPAELIDWKLTEFLGHDIDEYRDEVATVVYARYAESVLSSEGVKVSYVRPLLHEKDSVVSFWLEREDIDAGLERVDELAARFFGDDHPRLKNKWCKNCSFQPTCDVALSPAA